MLRKSSDVLIDTHLVIVQDYYHPCLAVAQVVNGFISEAARKSAVTDYRYDIELLAFEVSCPGDTHCS